MLLLAVAGALFGCSPKENAESSGDADDQYALDEIDGRDVEDAVPGGLETVVVAVVDTGVTFDDAVLQGEAWSNPREVPGPAPAAVAGTAGVPQGPVPAGAPGWDLIGSEEPPAGEPDDQPDDPLNHGTPVASLIAANGGDGGEGMTGVAPNAEVMALRACWNPALCDDAVVAAAIDWAVENGARVVNLSLIATRGHALIDRAIAEHPDTLFVAAAGNSAVDLDTFAPGLYPCQSPSPNVICVAATKEGGELSSCSNYGEVVDVAAPGEALLAARVAGGVSELPQCATSLATPHVSGLAAVLFGSDPEATPEEVRAAILGGVRRVPALDGRVATGGVIDVRRSLELLGREPAP